MSDRQVAKNRIHKGLTAHLRRTLRKGGVALDEEAAQFAFGGMLALSGQAREMAEQVLNEAFAQRRELMAEWEADNPKRNPYAPSFPERAIRLVNEALAACDAEDDSPVPILDRLRVMCQRELSIEPDTIYPHSLDE